MRTSIASLFTSLGAGLLAFAAACSDDPAGGGPGPGDAGVDAPPCTGNPRPEQAGNGDDDDCDGLIDELDVCATGDAGYRTVGEAVVAATDGGAIDVCPGTYVERFVVAGKTITIRGAGADATIIDGASTGTVIAVTRGAGLHVEGVTIRNGHSDGGGGDLVCDHGALTLVDSAVNAGRAEAGGGGVFAAGCALQVTRTRFMGNEGVTAGGALMLVDSTGAIVDSNLTGNAAERGGAIAVLGGAMTIRGGELRANTGRVSGGALFLSADTVVEDATIADNHAGWTGGGVYIDQHAPVIRRSTIDGNDAVEEGGGVYLHMSQATLSDNRITDNQAMDDGGGLRFFTCNATVLRNVIAGNRSGSDGGGFKASHLPNLFVDNEIVDNDAVWGGGGVELDNDSSVIRGGTIARNHAGVGGGIHAMLAPWAGATIEDVAIVDNVAVRGGGILLNDNFQPFALRRLTITGNVADGEGAGIYARTTRFTLTNATIANNRAGQRGGAIMIAQPEEAWTDPCPCPPVAPPVTVAFAVLADNTAPAGAAAWIGVANVTVTSSIAHDNHGVGVVVAGGVNPTWSYNDTLPASFEGMADPTGAMGNLSAPPDFIDPVAGDLRLRAGSACIDAGDPAQRDRDGSRADMGAFAGPEAP